MKLPYKSFEELCEKGSNAEFNRFTELTFFASMARTYIGKFSKEEQKKLLKSIKEILACESEPTHEQFQRKMANIFLDKG